MLLEKGPTVISTDGRYSEDTTVRVSAVRPDNGLLVPNFVGEVSITEVAQNGVPIYAQNIGYLPSGVSIATGGTATFVARSLAGPKSATEPPDAAQIKTVNYAVHGGGTLAIPQ
jgi:hypothetical protein